MEKFIPTEEDLKLSAEMDKKIFESIQITPRANVYTIEVPVFGQEINYYCGPATVKKIIHYIKGSSSSQSFYAGKREQIVQLIPMLIKSRTL